MIKSVNFTSGYPLDIMDLDGKKHVFDKPVQFTPGYNILFGPNGCGKSTIIKAIAVHGLTLSAWSNLDFMGLLAGDVEKTNDIADFFKENQRHCTAEVDLDGPVYWHNDVDVTKYHNGTGSGFGVGQGAFDFTASALMRMERCQKSSGENEMTRQGNMLENLYDGTWKFREDKFSEVYERRKATGLKYIDVLKEYADKTILAGGKPTLLLDEPERHLSTEHAYGLLTGLLPQLVEERGYQVIIATHYMLVPFFKDCNVIWLGRDEKTYRKMITDCIEGNGC